MLRGFIVAACNAHGQQLDASDPDADSVTLDGLTAILLLVDAVQGRPGSLAALAGEARTGKPQSEQLVPRLPPLLQLPCLTPEETRALLAAPGRCHRSPDVICDQTRAPEVHPLDTVQAVAFCPCELFAYQGSSLVAVLPWHGEGRAKPVVLLLPGLPGGRPSLPGRR